MRLDNFDIRLLRVFMTIADCGGFSAAQAHLGLSQSAISNKMHDLETRMGLRLCEGIEPAVLAKRFGLAPEALIDQPRFAFYADQGLCWREGARIGVTEAGMPLLDALLAELVPAELVVV